MNKDDYEAMLKLETRERRKDLAFAIAVGIVLLLAGILALTVGCNVKELHFHLAERHTHYHGADIQNNEGDDNPLIVELPGMDSADATTTNPE